MFSSNRKQKLALRVYDKLLSCENCVYWHTKLVAVICCSTATDRHRQGESPGHHTGNRCGAAEDI